MKAVAVELDERLLMEQEHTVSYAKRPVQPGEFEIWREDQQPKSQFTNLQFIKLGGSLITEKANPRTPRREVIGRLVKEIRNALTEIGDFPLSGMLRKRLVIGHGSGSFGHVPAKKYGTRQGVASPEGWQGFAEVWYEASTLNRIVMETLHAAGLPGVAFPASGGVTAKDGQVAAWDLTPLTAALEAGLLPVIYGDVAFDTERGGTILSTEDIFAHLARVLRPQRILLAGIDEGVWANYPACTRLIPEITAENWEVVAPALGCSSATDVTGGMASKVRQMLDLTAEIPGLEVLIFSGDQPGNVEAVLRGGICGTQLISKE